MIERLVELFHSSGGYWSISFSGSQEYLFSLEMGTHAGNIKVGAKTWEELSGKIETILQLYSK